ncbi:terminase small subunit [Skermanella pratensis]|uniref:terminase small subunit n=1 Tax=Skermanella pratensis TaxID=2233999 RepID=UPI0013017DC3|nr:terminase small subunit [Skermanella pratensis]
MQTPSRAASMSPSPAAVPSRPGSAPAIVLTLRQEAFCAAMALGVGGAEAARRAGYSPNGAKQRAALLMRQPEIRVRIDQIRIAGSAHRQLHLDDAVAVVSEILDGALEGKSFGLALKAVEFRLKLEGIIQDKRIAHHYHLDAAHPDADLERLDCDPEEELDHIRFPAPVSAPADAPVYADPAPVMSDVSAPAAPAIAPAPASRVEAVTKDDLRAKRRMTRRFGDVPSATALSTMPDLIPGPRSGSVAPGLVAA